MRVLTGEAKQVVPDRGLQMLRVLKAVVAFLEPSELTPAEEAVMLEAIRQVHQLSLGTADILADENSWEDFTDLWRKD